MKYSIIFLIFNWLTFFSSAQTTITLNGDVIDLQTIRGVQVAGVVHPLRSHQTWDSLEKYFVLQSFPDFNLNWFRPQTAAVAQQIQAYRQAHWNTVNGEKERTIEFIVNRGLLDSLSTKYNVADPVSMFIRHNDAMRDIWATAIPSINRTPVLKRIIFVTDQVVSDYAGGIEHLNDPAYSYWYNEKNNGVFTDVGYDIDSRWTFTEHFSSLYPDFNNYSGCNGEPGCKIDYCALHELTHHLPVGDAYQFNMGVGHPLLINNVSQGKPFRYDGLSYSYNDHMNSCGGVLLTAPQAYQILMWHKSNPSITRNPQGAAGLSSVNNHWDLLYDTLAFHIQSQVPLGIDSVIVMKEIEYDPVTQKRALVRAQPDNYIQLSFSNGIINFSLSKTHQMQYFPGSYLGLCKGKAVVPIFLPKDLMNTLFWKDTLYSVEPLPKKHTFEMELLPHTAMALNKTAQRINSSSKDTVDFYPAAMAAYHINSTQKQYSTNTIAIGKTDNKGNYYLMDWKASRFNVTIFPGNIRDTVKNTIPKQRTLIVENGEFGQTVYISAPQWIHLSQSRIQLSSYKSSLINITLNHDRNLNPGYYRDTIYFRGSSENIDVIKVPVDLLVQRDGSAFTCSPASLKDTLVVGISEDKPIVIQNEDFSQTINITAPQWVLLSQSNVQISPNQTHPISITLNHNHNLAIGNYRDTIYFRGTVTGGNGIVRVVKVPIDLTVLPELPEFTCSPASIKDTIILGTSENKSVTIVNGNFAQAVNITVPQWMLPGQSQVQLAPNQSYPVNITLNRNRDLPIGHYLDTIYFNGTITGGNGAVNVVKIPVDLTVLLSPGLTCEGIQISIFPNPSRRLFQVVQANNTPDRIKEIFVFDQLGRKVLYINNHINNSVVEINHQLTPGQYYMQIITFQEKHCTSPLFISH